MWRDFLFEDIHRLHLTFPITRLLGPRLNRKSKSVRHDEDRLMFLITLGGRSEEPAGPREHEWILSGSVFKLSGMTSDDPAPPAGI